jgi:hypothetical protein
MSTASSPIPFPALSAEASGASSGTMTARLTTNITIYPNAQRIRTLFICRCQFIDGSPLLHLNKLAWPHLSPPFIQKLLRYLFTSDISVATEMKDAAISAVGVRVLNELPPWGAMWIVAFSMFAVAKVLTLVEVRRHQRRLPAGRTAAYVLLWVGMDTRGFLGRRSADGPWRDGMVPGFVKCLLGALLLWGVAPTFTGIAAGWIGMIGMVLILHFGLFHLLAAFWANRGFAVEPIMNKPLAARTLAEFWGERWNRAFNELMHRFVFRPALQIVDLSGATLLVFLVSGVIHDLVISVPAGGGYGGPTAYFLIQGFALLIQRSRIAKRLGLNAGSVGRCFTAFVLVAPLPILFHEPFISQVILPFIEVIGAVPNDHGRFI